MSLHRKFLALALAIAAALPLASAQAEPFTFQGFLEQSGSPLNGNANLAFKLYDVQSGGTQQGATISANSYPVLDGVFTIDLNFAGVAFAEANRWLQVEVNGTPMGPRIEILPAPVAASARALQGRGVSATAPSSGQVLKWNGSAWAPAADAGGSSYTAGAGLLLNGTEFRASFGGSGAASNVARSDHGHYGQSWDGGTTNPGLQVENSFNVTEASALYGKYYGSGTRGTGVRGESTAPNGIGVVGTGTEGIRGLSTAGDNGMGVFGWRDLPGGVGVDGFASGDATTVAVRGVTLAIGGTAILGVNDAAGTGAGIGVHGKSMNVGGIGVHGEASTTGAGEGIGVKGTSNSADGFGVYGVSSSGVGVYGETATDTGVFGLGGLLGVRGQSSFQGVQGMTTGQNGIGVYGIAASLTGTSTAIRGMAASPDGHAIEAEHNATTGQPTTLKATTSAAMGAAIHASGHAAGGIGVRAQTTGTGPAIVAENFGTTGLATALRAVGASPNGTTSVFEATGGVGAWAIEARTSGNTGLGVYAKVDNASAGSSAAAVLGEVNSVNAVAIRGVNSVSGGLAGRFEGNVNITGTLSATTKLFRIDHPLDPANRYLQHIAIESDEMANIYSGNVVTDAKGYASIELPAWFEALNRDFRYQLTVIGSFARAMVAEEVAGNRFAIRTDEPNTKVSWQVTGIRQDAWAERNRIPVELDKAGAERGKYLHPEAHGAPADKRIGVGDQAKPAR